MSKALQMSHSVIIAAACFRIAAHPIIGHRWHKFFPTQQAAAESWLDYKARHPKATLEKWFGQFDSSVLPPPFREKSWII